MPSPTYTTTPSTNSFKLEPIFKESTPTISFMISEIFLIVYFSFESHSQNQSLILLIIFNLFIFDNLKKPYYSHF